MTRSLRDNTGMQPMEKHQHHREPRWRVARALDRTGALRRRFRACAVSTSANARQSRNRSRASLQSRAHDSAATSSAARVSVEHAHEHASSFSEELTCPVIKGPWTFRVSFGRKAECCYPHDDAHVERTRPSEECRLANTKKLDRWSFASAANVLGSATPRHLDEDP
jgi:hypothetical protein